MAALLVTLAGAALALAFPEPSLNPAAWVAIAPLLVCARRRRTAVGFGYGMLLGLGFFGVLIVWISLVGWLAWAFLVVLQAL